MSSKKRIAVIGAGAWGAWSALHLAGSGFDVTLFDMKEPGNVDSGSGGLSRIIRLVYGADEDYVKLTLRSFVLWEELFADIGKDLYQETGVLWLRSRGGEEYFAESMDLLKKHNRNLLRLSREETHERWPGLETDGVIDHFWEPRAGILEASDCVKLTTEKFKSIGGTLSRQRVNFSYNKGFYTMVGRLDFDQYVIAAGSWTRKLFPELLGPVTYVSRQEVFFYSSENQIDIPLWFDYDNDRQHFYGFPDHNGNGYKIAYDRRDVEMDPDRDHRTITSGIENECRKYLASRFPALGELTLVNSRVCHYDNSLDGHLIIDTHPDINNVLILTGSSGHGFKMAPAVGELAKDIIEGTHMIPKNYKLSRFSSKSSKSSQFSR